MRLRSREVRRCRLTPTRYNLAALSLGEDNSMAELLIRAYGEADALALLRIERACVEAEAGMVLDLEQLATDPRGFHESQRLDPELGTVVVAELGGELVGYASVRLLSPARIRHVAVFAVEVHPQAQGRGAGRALMEAAVAWALAHAARRLELYVRSDNLRAIALYRSLGFEREGVRKDFVLTRDGRFVDDWIMARLVASQEASATSDIDSPCRAETRGAQRSSAAQPATRGSATLGASR